MANGDLLEPLTKRLPKSVSIVVSAAFFLATMLMNFASNKTHLADIQQQQDKRLSTLEDAVKNDLVTRRELGDFKSDATDRLDRIEKKLDEVRGVYNRGDVTVRHIGP